MVTLPIGLHEITGTYSEGSSVSPSTSAAVTVEVVGTPTTTEVTATPTEIEVGDETTLTATISGANPTGTVEFFAAGTSVGTVPVVSGVSEGEATLAVSTLVEGTHDVIATYSGDDLNAPSSSENPLAVTVSAVPAPKPNPDPKPEPNPTPDPKPEPTPDPTPEPTPEPNPIPDPKPSPEPIPKPAPVTPPVNEIAAPKPQLAQTGMATTGVLTGAVAGGMLIGGAALLLLRRLNRNSRA